MVIVLLAYQIGAVKLDKLQKKIDWNLHKTVKFEAIVQNSCSVYFKCKESGKKQLVTVYLSKRNYEFRQNCQKGS